MTTQANGYEIGVAEQRSRAFSTALPPATNNATGWRAVGEDGLTLHRRAGDNNGNRGEFEPGTEYRSRLPPDLLAPFGREEMR